MKRFGFTLIETVVAVTLVGMIMTLAFEIYVNALVYSRKTEMMNNLISESRFTLERLVSEVRAGTIDYAEYWNWDGASFCEADLNGDGDVGLGDQNYLDDDYEKGTYKIKYGSCYQFYAASFYELNKDLNPAFYDNLNGKRIALEHLGQNAEDAIQAEQRDGVGGEDSWQSELYLINADGSEKTIIRGRANDNTGESGENDAYWDCNYPNRFADDNVNTMDDYCKIEMVKLVAVDADTDGKTDSWECADDFKTTGVGEDDLPDGCNFIQISSPDLHITNLKFFIAPTDDPYKAYNEGKSYQPHVMIFFGAEVPGRIADMVPGESPRINLQTTVAARVWNEVTLFKY